MQKIVPHLWFDKEAKEAAAFYVSVFGGDSKVTSTRVITGTPSGDCDVVGFKLWGIDFLSISAGPYFKPNPSISFFVNYDPLFFNGSSDRVNKEIDTAWAKLTEGGTILMPLDKYPFSERYGWVQDKYGFSWQLISGVGKEGGEERPFIIPSFLFVGKKSGKAEEAINFYRSVFTDSKMGQMAKYPETTPAGAKDTVMFSDFKLLDTWFAAMDGAGPHEFDFNEAISLIVNCEDQTEIDYYWEKLSAVPESEQCGWLKDKYGVSWQIVPKQMDEMMATGDKAALQRVTESFLKMKKFDLASLQKAYNG